MAHRGLCGTMSTTRRAPAVQVIPGFFVFSSSSPGTLFFYSVIPGLFFLSRHPRVHYFFILSSPGLTRGSIFQSTKSFTTSAGASRVSRYRTNRSLRPLPAVQVKSGNDKRKKPEHDSTSKHNLDRGKQWSNAASGTRCFQPAARLPCRSSPGTLFFHRHPRTLCFFIVIPGLFVFSFVIPGLRPGDPGQLYGFFIYLDCRIKSGNDKRKKPEHDSTSKRQHPAKKKEMQKQGDSSTFQIKRAETTTTGKRISHSRSRRC